MAIKPADMSTCGPKSRCVHGVNAGVAYVSGDECDSGYSFDAALCDCVPDGQPGEYQITYYKWTELYSIVCPGGADDQLVSTGDYPPTGAPTSLTLNDYGTGPTVTLVTAEFFAEKGCAPSYTVIDPGQTTMIQIDYTDSNLQPAQINITYTPVNMNLGSSRRVYFKAQTDTVTRIGDNP